MNYLLRLFIFLVLFGVPLAGLFVSVSGRAPLVLSDTGLTYNTFSPTPESGRSAFLNWNVGNRSVDFQPFGGPGPDLAGSANPSMEGGLSFPLVSWDDGSPVHSAAFASPPERAGRVGWSLVDLLDSIRFADEIPDKPSMYAGICGGLVLCVLIQWRRAKRGGGLAVFRGLNPGVKRPRETNLA